MRLLGTAPSAEMRSSAVHFQAGDVLYGRLRPYLNKVLRPSFEGLCSAEFIVFPHSERLNSTYLQYLLNSSEFVAFTSHLNTGDRPRVDFEQIASFAIPIPPLAEQRRIVGAIEEHLSRLDAAVAGLKRVQARLPGYCAAVVAAACTEVRHDTDVDCDTGRVEWTWTTIGELSPPGRKCAYGVLQPGPHVLGGVPLVRVGDIADGTVDTSNLKHIAPGIAGRYPRTRLQGGEVLLSLVGTIGRTALAPPQLVGGNVARAVGVIPVRQDTLPGWVEVWLRNRERVDELNGKAHEVARKTLNLEDVRATRVALPPLDVQRVLVAEVDRQASIANKAQQVVALALRSASGLRQSILHRAFSGQLVPQDPNDEPASVLLEHIRAARAAAPIKPRRPRKVGAR